MNILTVALLWLVTRCLNDRAPGLMSTPAAINGVRTLE
jgi:hypothetical protein